MITTLAVVAGLLQALGYAVYFFKSVRHETEPNPTTWLMFAYGTTLLTVLEWDREATPTLLILPIVCATLSVGVAILCKVRGTLKWPSDQYSRAALMTDVSLTVGYVLVALASFTPFVTDEQRTVLALAFLVLTNMSTAVSFVPLLKDTWEDPKSEHPLAWSIWTMAYSTLGIVTFLEKGAWTELMIYPVSCALLHGLVGLFALRAFLRPCHALRPR